jgi:hypothetical protein
VSQICALVDEEESNGRQLARASTKMLVLHSLVELLQCYVQWRAHAITYTAIWHVIELQPRFDTTHIAHTHQGKQLADICTCNHAGTHVFFEVLLERLINRTSVFIDLSCLVKLCWDVGHHACR